MSDLDAPPLQPSSSSVKQSSSGQANVKMDRWLLHVGVEALTTGVLKGSRSLATDLYKVSQSVKPRQPLRSMSGTERAFSTKILSSSTLPRIFSSSSSLTLSDGSRSHKLTSALEHSRILELPEIAVGGTDRVSKSCREGVSCAPSSGSWPDISEEGRGCGDSEKMLSSSSGSWHIGLCEARTYSSLSFSLRRLAISACNAALSSSSLSVS